jgi:hypothetical protein
MNTHTLPPRNGPVPVARRRAPPARHLCVVCGATAFWQCDGPADGQHHTADAAGGHGARVQRLPAGSDSESRPQVCGRWLCRRHAYRPHAAKALEYCPWHKGGR